LRKFLDTVLHIKPLFPINKQFSIYSFLGWEGHHWVFVYHSLLINFASPPPYRSHTSYAPNSANTFEEHFNAGESFLTRYISMKIILSTTIHEQEMNKEVLPKPVVNE